MNPLFFLLLLVLAGPTHAAPTIPAGGFLGEIYRLKGDRSQPFAYQRHEMAAGAEGKISATNTYTSAASGELWAKEKVEFDGERLVSYEQEQLQTGSKGVIEVKGGEIQFTYTKDGKTKTSKEKWVDNFIVGPSLVAFVRKNWAAIMKGDSVGSRFGVVDRLETVGFTFRKEKESEINGKKVVQVKMKPTSFIIAALVDPLLFSFEADGSRLAELDGRAVVKEKKDGKPKDFDGHTVYKWPDTQ